MDPTSGHMGTKRTLSRITERFFWPGVTKDVENLVLLNNYMYDVHVCTHNNVFTCAGSYLYKLSERKPKDDNYYS